MRCGPLFSGRHLPQPILTTNWNPTSEFDSQFPLLSSSLDLPSSQDEQFEDDLPPLRGGHHLDLLLQGPWRHRILVRLPEP